MSDNDELQEELKALRERLFSFESFEPLCPTCKVPVFYVETVTEWRYCAIDAEGNVCDTFEVDYAEAIGDARFVCDSCHKSVDPICGERL